MDDDWQLHLTTFSPAEICAFSGIPAGTQRQWWSRGFLGVRTADRARASISDVAGMLALQSCAEHGYRLERVTRALPQLSGAALHFVALALSKDAWAHGVADAHALEFKAWLKPRELAGNQYILDALNLSQAATRRFMVLTPQRVFSLDDLALLNDQDRDIGIFILDAMSLARRITRSSRKQLMWFTRGKANEPR